MSMSPRSWIKLALLVLPFVLVMAVGVLIFSTRTPVSAQPTPIPTLLADNSETRVDVSGTRLYSFSSTRLKLNNHTPGFAFAAEIRNAAGQTVASFTNLLQDIQLTLAPNSGFYQITVSAVDPLKPGTLAFLLGSAITAPATLDGTMYRAANCRVTNPAEASALVRSAPAVQYTVLGMLPASGSLPVIGKTDNDWYTVSFAERQGWIAGDVISLDGDCAALPVLRNPTIPNASADAPAVLLDVDRDGSGTLEGDISAPDGDTNDLIWVRIINLDTRPPNNYREFALTLDCGGMGTGNEALRWGDPVSPTRRCGESLVLPFLSGQAQTPIAVILPPGSRQSYVTYALSVTRPEAMG
jgi:hypothetical protein